MGLVFLWYDFMGRYFIVCFFLMLSPANFSGVSLVFSGLRHHRGACCYARASTQLARCALLVQITTRKPINTYSCIFGHLVIVTMAHRSTANSCSFIRLRVRNFRELTGACREPPGGFQRALEAAERRKALWHPEFEVAGAGSHLTN